MMQRRITQFKTRQKRASGHRGVAGTEGRKKSIYSELEKALKDPSLMKKKNPLD
jgi:hypothetical protein